MTTIDREAFISARAWAMESVQVDGATICLMPFVPTFRSGALTAHIIWRPVEKAGKIHSMCAWEVRVGGRGVCSILRYKHAEAAKIDAWEAMTALLNTS
jgi:hypothetical protein